MDLNKLPLFAMATKRMGWLAKRQEVLSQNVANADTPNFVPHDLKAQDFRAMVKAAGGGAQGVQPNPKLARKWYERARQLGANEADDRLRRLGAR